MGEGEGDFRPELLLDVCFVDDEVFALTLLMGTTLFLDVAWDVGDDDVLSSVEMFFPGTCGF